MEVALLNRWSRDPKLVNGKPVVLTVTPRLQKVFELLDPTQYRVLPLHYIHAFVGGSLQTLQDQLKLAHRNPNCFLRCPEQQKQFYNSNYRAQFYERDLNGVKYLQGLGQLPTPVMSEVEFFSHQVMIDSTFADLDLGARATGDKLLYPLDIVNSNAFPIATLKEKKPLSIPVIISKYFKDGTKHAKFDYTNDGLRGIRYKDGSHKFIQIEAERSNRVDCQNLAQTSFLKKFLAIKYIMDNKLYRSRWGLPNLLTLVVTPTDERIETMKKLILENTNNKGVPYILFQKVPILEEVRNSLLPNPKRYTTAWQRAGYPDFDLSKGEGNGRQAS
jgi:hypothetical protein